MDQMKQLFLPARLAFHQDSLTKLPHSPGVYTFYGKGDIVLYVGKSKDLRARVASYFNAELTDRPWTRIMRQEAKELSITITQDEQAALLLEATLIKEYRPKYNLKLTDDKSYPYLLLTIKETFPRLMVVRRPTRQQARLFGPYLSASTARLTAELVRKAYGIHLSKRPIKVISQRPCLNCQLEENLCPLAGEILAKDYQLATKKAISFLAGDDRQSLIKALRRKMKQAAEEENFELAGSLRNRLLALQETNSLPSRLTTASYNVLAVASESTRSAVALLEIRENRSVRQKSYLLEGGAEPKEVLERFLVDYYNNFSQFAPIILLERPLDDVSLIRKVLSQQSGRSVQILVPQRGKKKKFLELARKNAETALRLKSERTNQASEALWALKELLSLDKLPLTIEALDISNLGVSNPVGAIACFKSGQPSKRDYRRYNIKTVVGQNDFAMIQEIAERRLTEPNRDHPDVLLIDGGPQQLVFALKGAAKTRTDTTIISLAKKPDRLYLPNRKTPVKVSVSNKGLRLLASIRDEAHRFALEFQRRKRRLKPSTGSGLPIHHNPCT